MSNKDQLAAGASGHISLQHVTVRGLTGDPKRPAETKRYQRPVVNPDAQPPDGLLLIGLFFGIMGVLMKSKAASWGSLFACLSSIGSMSYDNADFKQLVSAVTFAVMGLVASYLASGTTDMDD